MTSDLLPTGKLTFLLLSPSIRLLVFVTEKFPKFSRFETRLIILGYFNSFSAICSTT